MLKRIYKTSLVQKILTGFNRSVLFRNATFVFLFHEVSDTPSPFHREFNLSVGTDVFGKQIAILRKLFNVISMDQFLAGEYEKPACLVSFDDGSRGYYRNAVPVLREQGVPSVNFTNMGPVKGEVFWSGLVTYLSRHQPGFPEWYAGQAAEGSHDDQGSFLRYKKMLVEEYVRSAAPSDLLERVASYCGPSATTQDMDNAAEDPLVCYGNHLYNHYNAVTLTEEEFIESYRLNEAALTPYANSRRVFSFPFGQPGTCYNERLCQLAVDCGAQAVFSACSRINWQTNAGIVHRIAFPSEVDTEKGLCRLLNDTLLRQAFSSLYS